MGVGWRDAVLWEEIGRARNAVTTGFGDKVEMAPVMIFGWAKEPRVKAMQGRGSGSFCIFVNDGFNAGWCHGVPIPTIRAFECFVCRDVGLDSGSLE
jgi:hypothetical protein